jgi:hypothetical protein
VLEPREVEARTGCSFSLRAGFKFHLIVTGSGTHWEAAPLSFGVDRLKEYSDDVANAVDIARPETLALLEGIPTLLVYEVGAQGPRPRTVRYGGTVRPNAPAGKRRRVGTGGCHAHASLLARFGISTRRRR